MAAAQAAPSSEKASAKQWIAVLGGVLGAFMAVLDISITNASLADIQGSLSAGIDEGSWIATSYLVAEIMVIPLTGWLSTIFSIRRYLIVNSIAFLFFSICCGLATNLPMMIFFRFFQGLTGGILIPMAASIIITVLPLSQRSIGFAMFGVVATFAPSLGPTIGGWLTVNYGWQYIFYLNIVPGIMFVAAIMYAIDPKPMKLELLKKGDWWGIGTMCVGLACLETVLEEGNRKDWFGDDLIATLSVISVVSLVIFFIIELKRKEPFINLRLVKVRNFRAGLFMSLGLGLGLYGSIYILPLYLATIQRYDALQIGTVMMWVGFPQLLITPFVPYLMKKFDVRIITGIGIAMFALSCYLNTDLTANVAGDQLRVTQIVRALGQPLIMTPLQVIAYSEITAVNVGSASGLFNMLRNLGGSVGIGILGTILARRYQMHFSRIAESISTVSVEAQQRLSAMTRMFMAKGFTPDIAHKQAIQSLYGTINREAYIMAYNDCFLFMATMLALSCISLFFVRKISAGGAPPEGGH